MEDLRKCGLIVWENHSDPNSKFIHRTVAEYFAYKKLLEEISKRKVAEILFLEIFCENSFKVVQMFFNYSKHFLEICDINSMKIFGEISLSHAEQITWNHICGYGNLFMFLVNCIIYVNSEKFNELLSKLIRNMFPYLNYINDDLEVLKILLDHFGPQQLAKIIIDGEFEFMKLQNNLSNAKF